MITRFPAIAMICYGQTISPLNWTHSVNLEPR